LFLINIYSSLNFLRFIISPGNQLAAANITDTLVLGSFVKDIVITITIAAITSGRYPAHRFGRLPRLPRLRPLGPLHRGADRRPAGRGRCLWPAALAAARGRPGDGRHVCRLRHRRGRRGGRLDPAATPRPAGWHRRGHLCRRLAGRDGRALRLLRPRRRGVRQRPPGDPRRIGAALAHAGWHDLEERVDRATLLRRVAAGSLMVAAILLYVSDPA